MSLITLSVEVYSLDLIPVTCVLIAQACLPGCFLGMCQARLHGVAEFEIFKAKLAAAWLFL
jgi:hypothetical protein